MAIPMFAIDPTKSPYREVEDFTGGQRTAQNALTSAEESVGKAFVGMGANMGELGQKVFDYAVKTREQEDFNEAQRKTNEYVDTMAKINREWQAGVTGENALDAHKRFAA